jgi:hypothetical protein
MADAPAVEPPAAQKGARLTAKSNFLIAVFERTNSRFDRPNRNG